MLLAAWSFYRGRLTTSLVLGGIACALIIVGTLLPTVARLFHHFWMRVAAVLGFVNSRVLLSVLFFSMFAVYGSISKLIGRDPLNRRGQGRASYWVPRKTTRQSKEQFERLF